MKLRQKLAMVLAAAMVVTAVPVTTMASSTNGYNKTISVRKDDFLDKSTGLALELKVDNSTNISNEVFYIKSEDFKFINRTTGKEYITSDYNTEADLITGCNVDVTVLSETQLKVTVDGSQSGKVVLPILGKVTGEVPTIAVDGEGSTLSTGKYTLMGSDVTVSDKAITAKVGDATNVSIDGVGEIANITIEEVAAGQLDGKKVTIELDTTELEFVNTGDLVANTAVTVEGTRGLAEALNNGAEIIASVDDETITLEFKNFKKADGTTYGRGGVVIKGLDVRTGVRGDVSTGDVKATITAAGDKTMAEVNEVVAKVAEYDVKLSVKDDKEVEFVAGGEMKEVEFTLAELAAGTLDKKDKVYFKVEGADVKKIGDTVVDGDEAVTIGPKDQKVELSYDKDDKEFTLDLSGLDAVTTEGKGINEDVVSKYTVKVTLAAKPDATDDIVVKMESRAFDDKELTVGTVKADRTFDVEKAQVVVGTKGQKDGSVVITEDKAKTFRKGNTLFIQLEEDAIDDGVKIKDFKVSADDESGLKVKKVDVFYEEDANQKVTSTPTTVDTGHKAKNVIGIQVEKEGKEAGSITIDGIKVDTTNATPDGTYKAKFSGTLVSHKDVKGNMEKEFVVVGEGTAKQTKVVFEVGATSYEKDGETLELPVAPFIDKNDRTMAPVRAIAEAFGCEEPDFFFPEGSDQLVVTITKGDTIVQFVNGSNVMTVNGGAILMSTTAQIVDGTTYVPARFLADALNIDVEWLPGTQEIVFTTK